MSQHLLSHEIRRQFLEFFRARGHAIVQASPLVPQRDPSLLFTTAGMVQFKPLYAGEGPLPYSRAASSQPCLRATDLEKVGHTARHLTFFEMLGNFSFGDYFKREAIAWAWEFLVGTLSVDPTRLYISVFEEDDEAAAIWQESVGLAPERVVRLGAKDNFWGPAGATGACGPSSEIYWDFGETGSGARCGRPFIPGRPPDDEHCGPSCDCDRFMEIWNLVFPQFNQRADESREPLARKGIDTGMSIERLATVLQGRDGIFETDLFADLRSQLLSHVNAGEAGDAPSSIRSDSTRTVGGQSEAVTHPVPPGVAAPRSEQVTAVKIISDHVRALTFVIAEGVYPGNEGRGYLVRRLLRRAYANGRLLGFDEPFLHTLIPTVVESMHGAYPLLTQQTEAVSRAVRAEEETFARTIEQGGRRLAKILSRFEAGAHVAPQLDREPSSERSENRDVTAEGLDDIYSAIARGDRLEDGFLLEGEAAFELYDTYGFPIELTRELVEGLGGAVDMTGFERAMQEQKRRARAASRFGVKTTGARPWRKVTGGAHSRFIGYTQLESPVKVRLVREGASGWPSVEMVLDRTPFYPEGGGQVADRGVIAAEELAVEVSDVQREADAIVHTGTVLEEAPDGGGQAARFDLGEFLRRAEDGPLEAHVAERHRIPTARNHTATHLLHSALRGVLGTHVRQTGSLVAPDHLRFDFSHFEQPTRDQIARVEHEVNAWILRDVPVQTAVTSLEEALASGAMALFGEKYEPKVRTVKVAEFSRELCGGTHVKSTGEIGPFLLVTEGSVGSGVRRVEAVTGEAALMRLRESERTLEALAQSLGVASRELLPRVEALLAEREALRTALEEARGHALEQAVQAALASAETVNGARIVLAEVPGTTADQLRAAGDRLLQQIGRGAAVLASVSAEGKIAFLAAVTQDMVRDGVLRADDLVREVAKVAGGSGGGKPHMALAGAKDVTKLGEALARGREVARAALERVPAR
jgi:alanyl-tRNA synthetase